MKVHVIDNFFEDPIAERAKALIAPYSDIDHNGLKYPGLAPVEDDVTFKRLQEILSVPEPKEKTCFYRFYAPGQEQQTFIHNDSAIGTFSAIVYLTEPQHCQGGLAFWKHKLLGWEGQPSAAECEALGLKDHDVWFTRVHEDGEREELWEMVDYVPIYFNRCVIFYSPAFHSRYPKEPIGESKENSRLIKTFFYQL